MPMPIETRLPDELPLRTRTPPSWALAALAQPLALLSDHAHLERKAAVNALALLQRWPRGDGGPGEAGTDRAAGRWAAALADVARDEVEHLALVLRLLAARGGQLSRHHANPYAAALHALVRTGQGAEELLDRLLISALIEARSCERFGALAQAAGDAELRALYRGLLASERGHFRAFLGLAGLLAAPAQVDARLGALLDEEARVLAAQRPGPRMHAGPTEAWGGPLP